MDRPSVEFRPSAAKAIENLDAKVFNKLKPKIDKLADLPRLPGCVKLIGHPNLFRIRVGQWRIIYEIDDAHRRMTITIVAHRREVSRGL